MPEIVSKSDLPPLEQIGLAAEYYPDYQNEHIRMHGIDVMLFSVVLSGRGIHYQQQESWPEESCSVTITRCGEHHSIVSLPGETMRIVNIYLDNRHFLMPALPDDLAEVITAFLPVSPTLMPREKQLTRITFSTADTMEFLALALVETGLLAGLILFAVIIALGLGLRNGLSRLNLLLVPRIAAVVIAVILIMEIVAVLSVRFGFGSGSASAAFPIIIMAWIIERAAIIVEEDGIRNALRQMFMTLAVTLAVGTPASSTRVQYSSSSGWRG